MVTVSAPSPSSPDAYGPDGRSPWLDVDWREHQRWVTVAGRSVNVIDMGEGPSLIFVHGLAGSWQNWLEQIPVFAADHRVIAMDLPGFGHSPMPREEISIGSYAKIVDGLCRALGVEAAGVVGNSMGGFIAAETAIAFPERVQRLVLVSAAGISIEHQRDSLHLPWLRRVERVLALYTAWMAARSDTVARRPRLRQATLYSVVRHPTRIPPPLAAEQLRGSGRPGFMDALDALTSYPIRERLEKIDCPTLVVWGDSDRLVPTRDADVFEQLIPNARKVIYPDTGHTAMLERPAAFNAELRAFLHE